MRTRRYVPAATGARAADVETPATWPELQRTWALRDEHYARDRRIGRAMPAETVAYVRAARFLEAERLVDAYDRSRARDAVRTWDPGR